MRTLILIFCILLASNLASAFTIDKFELGKTKCPFTEKNGEAILPKFIWYDEDLISLKLLKEGFPGLQQGSYEACETLKNKDLAEFAPKYKSYCSFPYKFSHQSVTHLVCNSGVVVTFSKDIGGTSHDGILKALSEKYKISFEAPSTKSYFDTVYKRNNKQWLSIAKGTDIGIIVKTTQNEDSPDNIKSEVFYFSPQVIQWTQKNLDYMKAEAAKINGLEESNKAKALKDSL